MNDYEIMFSAGWVGEGTNESPLDANFAEDYAGEFISLSNISGNSGSYVKENNPPNFCWAQIPNQLFDIVMANPKYSVFEWDEVQDAA